MRKYKVLIILLPALIVINSSCLKDNQEELFPELGICDTLNLSFNNDIIPIMANNCFSCHSNNSNSSGILLDSYESLEPYIENGKFLGVIRHDEGYIPMPFNSNQVGECSISKVEAWINQGAKEN